MKSNAIPLKGQCYSPTCACRLCPMTYVQGTHTCGACGAVFVPVRSVRHRGAGDAVNAVSLAICEAESLRESEAGE